MIVYRLSKKPYANDLSGYGAEKAGGRWNSKGLSILYTAASRALAVVEIAVHTPLGIMPIDYYLSLIEVPDNNIIKLEIKDLAKDWNRNPFVKSTQEIGNDFIRGRAALVLQVPSANVPGDFNYLINPRHPDFEQVRVKSVDPFEFDLRLFKK